MVRRICPKPCSVIIAERNINYLIDYQCPQCGAPATLEETDRLFTCGFCKVKSYLIPRGIFQYHFVSTAPAEKQLVYFPYWRVRGMAFFSLPAGVQDHFVDISRQAVTSPHFPFSVGFRSQTLKLQFVTPETQGYFIKPVHPLSEVMAAVTKPYVDNLPMPPLLDAVIGETASLIYSPYYVDRKIYDAIANQPLSTVPPEDFSVENLSGGKADGGIHFIPTLCPKCGWDLEGERDSLVLHCKNCSTAWNPDGDRLKPLAAAYLPDREDNVVYVPVWRITADVKGVALNNYADLIRLANLPKVVQSGMEELPFYFWVLAFKVRPHTFLTISKRFTGIQIHDELVEKLPNGRLLPVNIPPAEAAESLKLILSDLITPRNELHKILSGLEIKPHKARLVYIPFRDKMHELVQEQLDLALDKNQVRLASNL